MGASRRRRDASGSRTSAGAGSRGRRVAACGRRVWQRHPRLAAQRATDASSQPFDITSYETITSLEVLAEWVAQAREQGYVALDTGDQRARSQSRRSRRDFPGAPARARRPTCRCSIAAIPIFSAAAWCRGRSRLTDALAVLKPLLEDRRCSRSARTSNTIG